MKVKDKINRIFEEHPFDNQQPVEKWFQQILWQVLQEVKEDHEENLSQKADKTDIKMLIERSDEKFQIIQKEMNTRFEAMNVRFETLQREMNTRFETMQKEMNTRFEAVEKRFSSLQWMIGIGFTLLAIMMTLSNFIKK